MSAQTGALVGLLPSAIYGVAMSVDWSPDGGIRYGIVDRKHHGREHLGRLDRR